MPSVVGVFKVITNSGVIEIGDTFAIAPKSSSKIYEGSGSSVTGDWSRSFNFFSSTNTVDSDLFDQQIVAWPIPSRRKWW